MKITLDTGILISALITKDTPPDQLYQAWIQGLFELITSEAQLTEFERVVSYPKLQKYLHPAEAQLMIASLQHEALFVTDLPTVSYSPDHDDNAILATAIAGDADYIVSGDKQHMLSLKAVEGIPILTAREAVDILLKS